MSHGLTHISPFHLNGIICVCVGYVPLHRSADRTFTFNHPEHKGQCADEQLLTDVTNVIRVMLLSCRFKKWQSMLSESVGLTNQAIDDFAVEKTTTRAAYVARCSFSLMRAFASSSNTRPNATSFRRPLASMKKVVGIALNSANGAGKVVPFNGATA